MRKSEIQSTKSETNPKPKIPMPQTLAPVGGSVLNFGFRSFEFVSDFDIRISNFGRPAVWAFELS